MKRRHHPRAVHPSVLKIVLIIEKLIPASEDVLVRPHVLLGAVDRVLGNSTARYVIKPGLYAQGRVELVLKENES